MLASCSLCKDPERHSPFRSWRRLFDLAYLRLLGTPLVHPFVPLPQRPALFVRQRCNTLQVRFFTAAEQRQDAQEQSERKPYQKC
ncbi:hypothetical protein GCM10027066_24240 [Dyella jejuensis]